MTIDDTTLPSALRDLAASVPDDPSRLTSVHRRAARAHRRRRAVGAGAIAATMAATVAGAEVLVSSQHGRAPIAAASGGSPSTPGPALAACPPPPPPDQASKSAAAVPMTPPAIGGQFTAGGTITSPGTATSVTVRVDMGPLDGSTLTLAVTPASKVFLSGPTPDAPEVTASSTQLQTGEGAKFIATRTGTASYNLDELHSGAAAGSDTRAPAKQAGAPQGPPTPPAIGGPFKIAGTGVSSTGDSITVNVTGGNLSGTVTLTLKCQPPQHVAGDTVEAGGTRTGADTYVADVVIVTPATP